MIIQRKLFAKSDIVKGALAVGLGGAIGGALLGDSIDKSLGKRKFDFRLISEEKTHPRHGNGTLK